jgi:hypothetical protein
LAGQTFPTPTNCSSGLSGARVYYFVFQIAALRTAHINRSRETTTYSGWGNAKIQLNFLLTSTHGGNELLLVRVPLVVCLRRADPDERELVPTTTKKRRAIEAALRRMLPRVSKRV